MDQPESSVTVDVESRRFFTSTVSLFCLLVLLLSALFPPSALPRVPLCWFAEVAHRPCPGCGITRAFCYISHGDLGQAWQHNPFSFVFYLAFVGGVFMPIIGRRWPRFEQALMQSQWTWFCFVVFMAVFIGYGVWRMVYWDRFTWPL